MADNHLRKGKKTPKIRSIPDPQKQAKASAVQDYGSEKLKWSFSVVDLHGPFGWSVCDVATFQKKLANKVHHFETMYWREIEGPAHHAIGKDSLSKEANTRLNQINQNDVDSLFSLRLQGQERLIGIRDRDYFRILWWDPHHKVCPSTKRHT